MIGSKNSSLQKQSLFTFSQEFSFSVSKNEFAKKLYDHLPPNENQRNRSKFALDTSRGYCWSSSTKDEIVIKSNASAKGSAKITLKLFDNDSQISILMNVKPPLVYILLLVFLILFFGVFFVIGFLTSKTGMIAGAFAVLIPMMGVAIFSIRKEMKAAQENLTKEIYNVVSNI